MDGEVDVKLEVKEQPTPAPLPEDLAAHDYKQLLPKFMEKLHPMSRRQQQRVISALMEYPFENSSPKFPYPEERDLFYIGMQIQDCSFLLKKAVYELMQDSDKMKAFNEELTKLKEENKNVVPNQLPNS